jgi:hypothetical protein
MEPAKDCGKFKPSVVSGKEPPPREDWPLERIRQFELERGLEGEEEAEPDLPAPSQPPCEQAPSPAPDAKTP